MGEREEIAESRKGGEGERGGRGPCRLACEGSKRIAKVGEGREIRGGSGRVYIG